MKRWAWLIPIILVVCFSAVAFGVQKDYGTNWDDVEHLARGQAYFHFFLTGKTTNTDDTPFHGRISSYEKIAYDFGWGSKTVFGHPAATDIILATFNQIL